MSRLESYRVLGLKPMASKNEVKTAFRTLAKRYHPDVAGNKGIAAEFNRILGAYQELLQTDTPFVRFPSSRQKPKSRPAPKTDLFSLGNLVTNGKSTAVRIFAARSLGNCGQKGAYAYLRKSMFDTNEQVQIESIQAVGKLGIIQCAGELGSVFSKGNRNVKNAVLETVERIGVSSGFENILLSAMSDSQPEIRRKGLALFLKNQDVLHGGK